MWSGGMKWYAGIGIPDVSCDILKQNWPRLSDEFGIDGRGGRGVPLGEQVIAKTRCSLLASSFVANDMNLPNFRPFSKFKGYLIVWRHGAS